VFKKVENRHLTKYEEMIKIINKNIDLIKRDMKY